GLCTVAVLRAVTLALDNNIGGDMRNADSAISGIDMLSACTGRTESIHPQIFFLDVNSDAVINYRINPDTGKAGLALACRIKRRDTHQAVHATFRLRPAIGIMPTDLDSSRFNTRLFSR